MIAYKLCRRLKNGNITPPFINKKFNIPFGVWLEAESHPTSGFKVRPCWHCTSTPHAPHIKPRENRVWAKVEIAEYEPIERSARYGGLWYLAQKIKFIELI